MSAGELAVLVASLACCVAVVGLLIALSALRRQTEALRALAEQLGRQTVPLVADAHRAVDQAASELERVGAVLESTESVHATVDSASRLAYRAFANPVVKVLAVRAGAATGIRRLAGQPGYPSGNGTSEPATTRRTTRAATPGKGADGASPVRARGRRARRGAR